MLCLYLGERAKLFRQDSKKTLSRGRSNSRRISTCPPKSGDRQPLQISSRRLACLCQAGDQSSTQCLAYAW
ncbi:hypothetical protein M3J09_009725 [Ascochyta lentis]